MRFKKIYIEITNKCNLSCSFCSKGIKEPREMNISEFKRVIDNIKNHTDYIYLHVKGEPLNHSDLEGIFKIVKDTNLKIILTTNGVMLNKKSEVIIAYKDIIRQINISVHSFLDNNLNKNYLTNLVSWTKTVLQETDIIISYRFWNNLNNKNNIDTFRLILNSFNKSESLDELIKQKSFKINNQLYINKSSEFIWPNINNEYYSEKGTCYGLKDQLAILADGTVVPCCLDADGIVNLGNIFKNELTYILSTDKVSKIQEGFKCGRKTEELCRHCNFLDFK